MIIRESPFGNNKTGIYTFYKLNIQSKKSIRKTVNFKGFIP